MAYPEYYTILGVAATASAEEIKKNYRRLAKKYHPDLNAGDAAAEDKFKKINEAYETLGDEDKRRSYDFLGKQKDARAANQSKGSSQTAAPEENPAAMRKNEPSYDQKRRIFEETMIKSYQRYLRSKILHEIRNRLLLILLLCACLYWCFFIPKDLLPQKWHETMFSIRNTLIPQPAVQEQIKKEQKEVSAATEEKTKNTVSAAKSASSDDINRQAVKKRQTSKQKDNKIYSLETAFRQAVLRNDIKRIKLMLDYGLSPNLTDSKGCSLLMLTDNLLTAEMLLKAGADVNYENPNGESALSLAVKKNQTGKVRLLMKYGAKVNWQKL